MALSSSSASSPLSDPWWRSSVSIYSLNAINIIHNNARSVLNRIYTMLTVTHVMLFESTKISKRQKRNLTAGGLAQLQPHQSKTIAPISFFIHFFIESCVISKIVLILSIRKLLLILTMCYKITMKLLTRDGHFICIILNNHFVLFFVNFIAPEIVAGCDGRFAGIR